MADDFGLEAFKENCDVLSLTLRKKLMWDAVKQAAPIIEDEMRTRAPELRFENLPRRERAAGVLGLSVKHRRVPGALKALMMTVMKTSQSSAAEVVAWIGPAKSTFYGLFSEVGTEKESAKPWMRPSFDSKVAEAQASIGAKLWNGIQETLASIARQ